MYLIASYFDVFSCMLCLSFYSISIFSLSTTKILFSISREAPNSNIDLIFVSYSFLRTSLWSLNYFIIFPSFISCSVFFSLNFF